MTTVYRVDAVLDGSGTIVGDRVIVTDGRAEVTGVDTPGVETVDRGGFVVPGIRDAHVHLGSMSAATTGITLEGASDMSEVTRALARRGSGDVVAIGFDETRLADGRLLTRSDLDAVIDDRAVLVYRVCGHIAMANTVALERAGIDRNAADPPGGSFDRASDGAPTGVLRETAIDAVSAVTNDSQRDITGQDLVTTARRLADLGLSRVDSMVPAGAPAWCGPEDELRMLVSVAARLPLDVSAILISDTVEDLERGHRLLEGRDRVTFGGWKGFADGSLGGHTAALSKPYEDTPGTAGTIRSDPDHFREMAEASLGLDGSVCIHAIGDAAVGAVLDLFESLVEAGAPADRLRIEHASILTERLVERMAASGIVASVQPAFVPSDRRWLNTRLGDERARWAYPFRSMLDAGVRMIGGSDAPVERPDPLAGMRAAVDRGGFHPEEGLDAIDAVRLFVDPRPMERATWIAPDLSGFEVL